MECTICMEVITRGVACYRPHCKTRLHNHCFDKYRKRQPKCPTCNENWSNGSNIDKLIPVGEGAFREGQDQGRRRARRKATAESDEDEDEEMDPGESQPSQPTQPSQPSQTQAKKGKKKAVREESMDVDEEEEVTPPPRTQKRKGRR